jgi:aldehyde dehydrogenase (NAD+)
MKGHLQNEHATASTYQRIARIEVDLTTPIYNLVNGRYDASGGTIDVVNPATGEKIASVPDIDQDGLERAVKATRDTFPARSTESFAERKGLLESSLTRSSKIPPSSSRCRPLNMGARWRHRRGKSRR